MTFGESECSATNSRMTMRMRTGKATTTARGTVIVEPALRRTRFEKNPLPYGWSLRNGMKSRNPLFLPTRLSAAMMAEWERSQIWSPRGGRICYKGETVIESTLAKLERRGKWRMGMLRDQKNWRTTAIPTI